MLTGAGLWALPAQDAPGDRSAATGRYLSGSLIGLDTSLAASLDGQSAESNGTADQTNASGLKVGALGTVNLTTPGGLRLPLSLDDVGVVEQYASALRNASSMGASGLTSATGAIGAGITPAPGLAPGPLHLGLAQAVSSLGLPAATLNELAQLDLRIGVTADRAAQAAPGSPAGSSSIADTQLRFQSPTLAALAGAIRTQVGAVQTAVDNLSGPSGTLAAALKTLLLSGTLTTTASVSASTLLSAVSPLLSGTIADPAYPGVSIDLGTGTVTVDLDSLTTLEGLAPNTELLTGKVIDELGDRISGVAGSLFTHVENTLTTAIGGLSVTASVSRLDVQVVTVNSTIGALRSGSTSGIALAGAGLALSPDTVLSTLNGPLNSIGSLVTAIGPTVIAPVTDTLIPALEPVLSQVVSLTANSQSTAGGVFTETALRATVLPRGPALVLNVANASVGPNALAGPPTATGIAPAQGPAAGGTDVTLTGTGFTGATSVTFGGAPAAKMTVMDDTTIIATTPAHLPATVSIAVEHPNGDSSPDGFTFDAVPGAPVISDLAPGHGPAIGGTAVTLSGSEFTGTTAVTVDDVSVPFTVIDDSAIAITAPPHAAGNVPIVVTTPIGPTPSVVFTYDMGTTVDGMTPSSGPETGGTAVTITGGCFTDATGVLFGTTPATSFRVMTDATIAAVSPAGNGTAEIAVVGAAACGTGTLTGAFRYLDPDAPIIIPAGDATSTGVAAGHGAGRLAGTGSTTDGFALPAGIGLLMLACGGLIILRRTRRA